MLALTATAANAQGAWFDVPPVSAARSTLAGAAAPCPEAVDDARRQVKDVCVYAFGGTSYSADTGEVTVYDTVEAYDPAANEWTTLAPLPTERDRLAGAAAPCPEGQDPEGQDGSRGSAENTCVYAIGGSNLETEFLDTVEAYDPATDEWETLPPLPTPRRSLTAAAAPCPKGAEGLKGTCVYAIGGLASTGSLDTVEAYSPATNQWVTLAAVPTARSVLAGAAAPCPRGVEGLRGTCVYAAGGFDGSTFLNTVEAYSPATDRWVTVPALPTARGFLAATSAPCDEDTKKTCVYTLGGRNATGVLATVEAYNPADNRWTTLPSLQTARDFPAAAAAPCPKKPVYRAEWATGTCVYAVAGETGIVFLDTVEALAVGSDQAEGPQETHAQRPGSLADDDADPTRARLRPRHVDEP